MKLHEVCEFIVDCPHSTAPDEGIGYPLIRTPNIGRGRLILDGVQRVSERVYLQRNLRATPRDGDLIFAREAPAGNVAVIKNGEKVCLGQRTVLIRPDSQKVDSDFLAYYLLLPEQQYNLLGTANGATVAHVNLPTIRNLKISLPPLETQKRIADVLSAYDDLIENNERQIRLLEEAAQRLYKEWFVRLHFPGYESTPVKDGMPEGWKKDRADAFFQITIGKTPPRSEQKCFTVGEKGVPWVSIADMGNAHTFIAETEEGLTEEAIEKYHVKVIPADTILLSFKLTVGRVAIATSEMCTNEAIAHFWLLHKWQREYVYCYLSAFHYDSLGSTSSISKAINSQMVKAMPFIMPDEKVVREFSKLACPLFEAIYICVAQNKLLQEARDRLLPKLMNGEIEV